MLGAIGEYAYAIVTETCWRPAVGRLDTQEGDVGGMQIKATALANGSLIVREHDPPDRDYLLVIVPRDLRVNLAGWIAGADAKQSTFWRDRDRSRGVHQAAYFVPQHALHPLVLDEAA